MKAVDVPAFETVKRYHYLFQLTYTGLPSNNVDHVFLPGARKSLFQLDGFAGGTYKNTPARATAKRGISPNPTDENIQKPRELLVTIFTHSDTL